MDSKGYFDSEGRWKDENPEYFKRWLSKYSNQRAIIKLKKWRKQRSGDQNAYYWAVVISHVRDNHGFLDDDEAHEFCKTKFNKKQRSSKITKAGNIIITEIGGSTAGLDTLEFEEYLEKIRTFEAVEFGDIIPLPNEVIY